MKIGGISSESRISPSCAAWPDRQNLTPESEAFFAEAVRLELEVKGQVPAYLKGQIALLRLAEKRYDEARQEFERYFQSFDDGKPSSNPLHLPIIEGYEQLLREIGQAQE